MSETEQEALHDLESPPTFFFWTTKIGYTLSHNYIFTDGNRQREILPKHFTERKNVPPLQTLWGATAIL
jgi:hypothetical protein